MAFGIEPQLLHRATLGDRAAMNDLLEEVAPVIEKQLLRYPVSDDDRRDLLQAALIQITRRVGSFRGDSSFSTWLFRVTANEALMMMRSQRRLRARISGGYELDDLADLAGTVEHGAEHAAAQLEEAAAVQEAIRTLPDDYREVVVAHYASDLSLHEIAATMSLTESAVRSRLHRARARLRAELSTTDFAPAAAA
ncbi:MAG TPA: RNA polymerase sigma factor [Polyangiaceae bacterium]|nr:RNA polymerase sigma factor [Polyangiaceae bacterium]